MTRVRTLCALVFTIALSVVVAGPASAAVAPRILTGNPNCATLNASADPAFSGVTSNFGLKIEAGGQNAVPNGNYPLVNGGNGKLTGGAPADPLNSVTISNSNGTTFDWLASLGIDAVIVKGGDDSNVYVYTPEALADSGLLSPTKNGGTPALSHVEFCYDYETPQLDIVKTVQPKYKRTWTWDIDKSADQTTGGPLSPGDVFEVNYDVTVSATSADSDHAVDGTITVTNNTQLPTSVSSVTDELNDGTPGAVVCPQPFPVVLQPAQQLVCSYTATGLDGTENNNTATVSTSSGASGNADDAAIDWNSATVNSIDECVDVEDDKGGSPAVKLGTVCAPQDLDGNGDKKFQYKLDVASGGSCSDHTNTAAFKTNDTATTGSDSWTVALTCAPPPQNNPGDPITPQSQPEPQQQLQDPPQQQVLGERVTPGTARFAGATGCQGKAFTVRVKGRSISRVEFSIDGKRLATDRTPDSQGRYTFRVNPNKFKPGSHRITARAVFTSASGTRPKTMSGRFSRCVRAAQAPAFTG